MSELDDIKAQAAERRNPAFEGHEKALGGTWPYTAWEKAEADLDRAIAIAEKWEAQCEEVVAASQRVRERLTKERDEAIAALADAQQAMKEREQTIINDVLKLRDAHLAVNAIDRYNERKKALAETESYEKYR